MLFAHLEQCLFDFGWCHRYRAGLCLDLQMGPRGGVVARVSPGSQRGTRLDLGGSTSLLHIGPLIAFLCTPCNVCLAVGMRGKHAEPGMILGIISRAQAALRDPSLGWR